MAAPKNNEFWKLRSQHGRKKLFESSELLWEAACEYFAWCVKNPVPAYEISAGKKVKIDKLQAFTLNGLCLYLGVGPHYFNEFSTKCSEDFSEVVTRIREVIYQQKFIGAAAGVLVPNIIARDLGLVDKKELEGRGSFGGNSEEINTKLDNIVSRLNSKK